MKVVVFILGLIIAGGAAYHYVPQIAQGIENGVIEDVTAKLVPNDLPADVQINVDGRDVTLSGQVETKQQKQRFTTLSRQVEGIRTVENNLVVAEPVLLVETETERQAEALEDQEVIPFDPLAADQIFDFTDEENDVVEVVQDAAAETVDIISEKFDVVAEEVEENIDSVSDAVDDFVSEDQGVSEEMDADMAENSVVSEPEMEGLEEIVEEEEIAEEEMEVVSQDSNIPKSTIECQGEITALLAGKKVNFETGQAKIEKESLPLLDSIAEEMADCSDIALHIHGYTDNVGDEDVNKRLSHSRAKSVGLYFLSKGVKQRVKVFGHGSDQPIADNDTEEGRMANRRIDFTVVDEDQSVANDNENTVKTYRTLKSIRPQNIIAQ